MPQIKVIPGHLIQLQNLLRDPTITTLPKLLEKLVEGTGVSKIDILGKSRMQHISNLRQVGMFIARERTDLSLEQIGNFFGNRDHTTVLYASGRVKKQLNLHGIQLVEPSSQRVTQSTIGGETFFYGATHSFSNHWDAVYFVTALERTYGMDNVRPGPAWNFSTDKPAEQTNVLGVYFEEGIQLTRAQLLRDAPYLNNESSPSLARALQEAQKPMEELTLSQLQTILRTGRGALGETYGILNGVGRQSLPTGALEPLTLVSSRGFITVDQLLVNMAALVGEGGIPVETFREEIGRDIPRFLTELLPQQNLIKVVAGSDPAGYALTPEAERTRFYREQIVTTQAKES